MFVRCDIKYQSINQSINAVLPVIDRKYFVILENAVTMRLIHKTQDLNDWDFLVRNLYERTY